MEKLQPFIKHHYWICFGLVVIFALTGWWIASGSIAEATETRRSSVDDSFRKSEKSQASGVPNQKWIEGAKALNQKDQKAYDEASRQLWERQKKARVWHPRVADEMKSVGYFEPIENMLTRVRWGENYKVQFEEILDIVKPFDQKTGEGLVIVNPARITHENFEKWRARTPLTEEVWRNQEDLWLTKEILEAIAATNAGASRISESAIPEIVQLRFRGGDRDAQPPAAGGGGESGFGGGGAGGAPGLFGGGGSGSAGMMSGGYGGGEAMGGASGPWKDFAGKFGADLLGEEFGMTAGGAGGAGGFGGGWEDDDDGEPPGAGGSFGMGSGGAMSGGTAAPADRYVDEDEDGLGYKTRAFLLQVKIRESDIPALLASLTNSDFPVEIVRVDFKAYGGGALAMGGGMGAGGPAGSSGMGGGMLMGGNYGEDEEYGEDYEGGYGAGSYGSAGYGAGGTGEMGMGEPPAGYGGEDEDDEYGGSYGAGGYGAGYGGTSGLGGADGMGYGGMGGGTSASRSAQERLAAAMGNPYLRELRIAGLMTLYQSEEESDAEMATEAAAAEEAAVGGRLPDSTAPDAQPEDSAETGDGTETDAGTDSENEADPASTDDTNPDAGTPDAASPGTENTEDASGGADAGGAEAAGGEPAVNPDDGSDSDAGSATPDDGSDGSQDEGSEDTPPAGQ